MHVDHRCTTCGDPSCDSQRDTPDTGRRVGGPSVRAVDDAALRSVGGAESDPDRADNPPPTTTPPPSATPTTPCRRHPGHGPPSLLSTRPTARRSRGTTAHRRAWRPNAQRFTCRPTTTTGPGHDRHRCRAFPDGALTEGRPVHQPWRSGLGRHRLRRLSDARRPTLAATYDIVGFDPRGTGQSDPLTCLGTADLDTLNAFDPTPERMPSASRGSTWSPSRATAARRTPGCSPTT